MAVTKDGSPRGEDHRCVGAAGSRQHLSRRHLSESSFSSRQPEKEEEKKNEGLGGERRRASLEEMQSIEKKGQKQGTAENRSDGEGGMRGGERKKNEEDLFAIQTKRDELILLEALRFLHAVRTFSLQEENEKKNLERGPLPARHLLSHGTPSPYEDQVTEEQNEVLSLVDKVKTVQVFLSLMDVKARVEEIQRSTQNGRSSSVGTSSSPANDRLCHEDIETYRREVLRTVETVQRSVLSSFPVDDLKRLSSVFPLAQLHEKKASDCLHPPCGEESEFLHAEQHGYKERRPCDSVEQQNKEGDYVESSEAMTSGSFLISDELIDAWAQEVSTTDEEDDEEGRRDSSLGRRRRRTDDSSPVLKVDQRDGVHEESSAKDTQEDPERELEIKGTSLVKPPRRKTSQEDRDTIMLSGKKDEGERTGETSAIEMVPWYSSCPGVKGEEGILTELQYSSSTKEERHELLSYPDSSVDNRATSVKSSSIPPSHHLRRRRKFVPSSSSSSSSSSRSTGAGASHGSPGGDDEEKNLEQELLDYAQEMKEEAKRYGDVIKKDCDRLGRTGTLQQTHIDHTKSAAKDTKNLIFSGGFGFFYAMLLLLVGCILFVLMITFILFIPG
ncbi:transmembrane protein [Cystoisospora suis]|uniref:Transmembrane protein n=1 Tax=Cystoisospora suis TaxID=483139 RepID=A0A2C6LCR0_9APIC|nr:transmembrane protein [Cystoisospora suis]